MSGGMGVTLRHYEIFRAVAQSGSFSAGGGGVYITQSAVSHAVRELEGARAPPLFERLPRGVALTQTGRLLLEEAPILQASASLEARLDALASRAPLRLASSITIAAFPAARALKRLAARYPELPVQVEVAPRRHSSPAAARGPGGAGPAGGRPPRAPSTGWTSPSTRLAIVCAPDYPCPAASTDAPAAVRAAPAATRAGQRHPRQAGQRALPGRVHRPAAVNTRSTPRRCWRRPGRSGRGRCCPGGGCRAVIRRRLIRLQAPELALTTPMLALWRQETPLTEPLRCCWRRCAASPEGRMTKQTGGFH